MPIPTGMPEQKALVGLTHQPAEAANSLANAREHIRTRAYCDRGAYSHNSTGAHGNGDTNADPHSHSGPYIYPEADTHPYASGDFTHAGA